MLGMLRWSEITSKFPLQSFSFVAMICPSPNTWGTAEDSELAMSSSRTIRQIHLLGVPRAGPRYLANEQGEFRMATCACTSAGKPKCAWCKEAEAHGIPPARHNCQWGKCS